MEEITYGLNSGDYYEQVNQFSKQVKMKIEQESAPIITDFMEFIERQEIEELRTRDEYLFEFLALGVLANIYLNDALKTAKSSYLILQKLVKLRNKYSKLKPVIDFWRGILSTILLYSDKRESYNHEFVNKDDLKQLIKWLAATGEHKEIVHRFKIWEQYFKTKFSIKLSSDLKVALNLANWFEEQAKEELGAHTKNVERFLEEDARDHLWSDDLLLCAKPELEYHLNMVGAEIMNQALRDDFLATEKKIVLAPVCMRNKTAQECQAQQEEVGLRCTYCDRDCNINLISSLGSRGEFEVVLINHSSDFSKYLKQWAKQSEVGLIGITCVLNLLAAGYELQKLNISGQCIVLDYSGCKQHWSPKGVVTEINLDKLLQTIRLNPNDKFVQMRFFTDDN
ncbi:MAG: DUF116 domain-containing protein [Bacillota bacterium]